MINIETINPELNKIIEINSKRQLGATAAVWLHERARRLDEYNIPVDCWQIGKDGNGNEISINTLGRWLFGVPGYDGHIRVISEGEHVTVHYPSEPGEADSLFAKLKITVEGEDS